MSEPFDSAWLKWGRAVVHAQTIDREIAIEMADFNATQPFAATTEYDAKRHAVVLKIVAIQPPPARFGLLVGDAANNFRSSLDHLAWALVTTRGKRAMTSDEERNIYFPMAKTEAAFNSHLVVAHLLRDRERRIIRRFQPFWNTARGRPHAKRKIHLHCLSVLPDVSRDDKHKYVRPVWNWPTSGQLLVSDHPVDCTITRIPVNARGIVLEPGAEIQRVYVRRTGPNPDLHMEAHLTVQPTIDGRIALLSWLGETIGHIRDLLRKFSEPPDEIRSLGIVPGTPPT